MIRRRRGVAAALALAGILGVAAMEPTPTEAAWVGAEVGTSSSLQAGTVAPVTQMTCTAGLLQPVTFSWTAPAGGLTRTSYRWTVTGGLTGSGTLAAGATSVSLNTGILGLGAGTFSLFAVGPGGWEAVAKTGSLSFATVVLDVLSTCSVP
ncbi:hypothetical protein [Microbacterium kyungheense]|uniref:Ig-like domain-containing protein n=1 Tax=Microbacterium kyungheense TaxID=1263636 RepID=A0A543FJ32_9MICO|nr:hypothetical protein [Microbacterium kyungheense]TQM33883.1 hypothetical protein FB391_0169 [Microbacterium kyungheense]